MKGFAATDKASSLRRTAAIEALYVFAGVVALAVSARISVPFWPVPVTAQTLAVLLVGALLGPTRGALTVVMYLAAGASGLPVFAMGGGIGYFAGPTAGYLIGFIPAAWLAGTLVPRWSGRRGGLLAALTLATAVIFFYGLAWLSTFLGFGRELFMKGLIPFLPGAALKIALAGLVLRGLRR